MAIYLKYGDIKGAVTTQGFKDWIELDSFQWGVGRSISSATRGHSMRESSEPSISEITVTKRTDVSTPKLFLESVAGKMSTKVTIALTTTHKGDVAEYLKYELTDTGIRGYSLHTGGDMPTESLSLNFTKVSMTFKNLDPTISGNPETVGYDLTKMTTT